VSKSYGAPKRQPSLVLDVEGALSDEEADAVLDLLPPDLSGPFDLERWAVGWEPSPVMNALGVEDGTVTGERHRRRFASIAHVAAIDAALTDLGFERNRHGSWQAVSAAWTRRNGAPPL